MGSLHTKVGTHTHPDVFKSTPFHGDPFLGGNLLFVSTVYHISHCTGVLTFLRVKSQGSLGVFPSQIVCLDQHVKRRPICLPYRQTHMTCVTRKQTLLRLTASSMGHFCNEGIFAKLMERNYELHLFGQICTSQVVIKFGRNIFPLHSVSHKVFVAVIPKEGSGVAILLLV